MEITWADIGEYIKIPDNPVIFKPYDKSEKVSSVVPEFTILIYSPVYPPVSFTLDPMGEVILSWDQIKNNGELVSDGVYKISVHGIDSDGKNVEKSITVSIWK